MSEARTGWPATAVAIVLLKDEKELIRRNDELAQKRRALPWVPVEKDYSFETNAGTTSLAELFDGRSQLLTGLEHRLGLDRRQRLQPRPRLHAHGRGTAPVPGG